MQLMTNAPDTKIRWPFKMVPDMPIRRLDDFHVLAVPQCPATYQLRL